MAHLSQKILSFIVLSTLITVPLFAQPTCPCPKPSSTSSAKPTPEENVTIPKATIKDVNRKTNQVTILPCGLADQQENYIVLNISPETVIKHECNKKNYKISDLKKRMEVKVIHAPIMTLSIPPQTPAIEITILGNC